MSNFGLWMGVGAAKRGAAKPADGKSATRRHHLVSIIGGILLALLIAAGLFIVLLVN